MHNANATKRFGTSLTFKISKRQTIELAANSYVNKRCRRDAKFWWMWGANIKAVDAVSETLKTHHSFPARGN